MAFCGGDSGSCWNDLVLVALKRKISIDTAEYMNSNMVYFSSLLVDGYGAMVLNY